MYKHVHLNLYILFIMHFDIDQNEFHQGAEKVAEALKDNKTISTIDLVSIYFASTLTKSASHIPFYLPSYEKYAQVAFLYPMFKIYFFYLICKLTIKHSL